MSRPQLPASISLHKHKFATNRGSNYYPQIWETLVCDSFEFQSITWGCLQACRQLPSLYTVTSESLEFFHLPHFSPQPLPFLFFSLEILYKMKTISLFLRVVTQNVMASEICRYPTPDTEAGLGFISLCINHSFSSTVCPLHSSWKWLDTMFGKENVSKAFLVKATVAVP